MFTPTSVVCGILQSLLSLCVCVCVCVRARMYTVDCKKGKVAIYGEYTTCRVYDA